MFKRVPIVAVLMLIVVLTVGATAAFGGSKPPTLAQRVAALEAQVATLTEAVSVMQESQHQMLQGQAMVAPGVDDTRTTILTIPGFGEVNSYVVAGREHIHFANTLSGETLDLWMWRTGPVDHGAYHVVLPPGDNRGVDGWYLPGQADWFHFVVVKPGGHSATIEVYCSQIAADLPVLTFATAEVR